MDGEGSNTPVIFFIGEAPGVEELAQGRPLVGPPGQRLKVLVERVVGVDWADTWRDNLHREAVPGGRNPKKAEITAQVDGVYADIERTDPDYIVLLGGVPTRYILGEKVTDTHGRLFEVELAGRTRKVIPWLHPNFTLRNVAALEYAVEDAEKLGNIISSAKRERVGAPVRAENTQRRALVTKDGRRCDTQGRLQPDAERQHGDADSTDGGWDRGTLLRFAFDLETTAPRRGGRFNALEARIVGWSAAAEENFATYHSQGGLGGIDYLLEDPAWEVICHNVKFELGVLGRHGVTLRNYHDTKGLAYVLGYPDTTLKGLARRLLGATPTTYKELAIPKDADWETTRLTHEANYEYGAADSANTIAIFNILWAEAEREGVLPVYTDIEMPLVPAIIAMEQYGVGVDESKAQAVYLKIEEARDEARRRVQEHLGEINPGSRAQLADALREAGAPLVEQTVQGNWRTDRETLRKLRDWNPPVIDAVLSYYDMVKRGSFIKGWLRLRGSDGRLHPNINQFGHYEEAGGSGGSPDTGRISESGPNLQQAPNHEDEFWGPFIRQVLVAGDDLDWLSVDFTQQEPRIGAWMSGDDALLTDFNNGVDVYSTIASEVYGIPITKGSHPHERQVGKQFLLAWLYGAGAAKLTELDPAISMAQARRGLNRLNKRYPKVSTYIKETRKFLKLHGYSQTAYGRKRWLTGIYSNRADDRARALRQAANQRIQGTGADVVKQVIARLFAAIEAENLPIHLMNTVHDSIDMAVRRGDTGTIKRVAELLSAIVAEVIPEVALPLEYSLGSNWGELTDIDPLGETFGT